MKTSLILRCTVCGESRLSLWGKRNDFHLYECKNCTHRFADLLGREFSKSDPIKFRQELTHGLMDSDRNYYLHLKVGELPGNATYITATRAISICKRAGIEKGAWLDVGSGSGYLLSKAKENGYTAIGIEPGGWGQLAAQEKGVTVKQAFLEPTTFDQTFDIVSATDVIEHVANPVQFLRTLRQYTNPNGGLVFSIPCADSFEGRIFGVHWDMVEPPTHSQFFSHTSLAKVLLMSGFRMEECEQFSVRPFLGLGSLPPIRAVIDAFLDGPQLVGFARPI